MIRIRPELRVTVTKYLDMEESSAGSCSGSESSGLENSSCSGGLTSPGLRFGEGSSRGYRQKQTNSPQHNHHHHHHQQQQQQNHHNQLTINHPSSFLTLDWTEESRSSKCKVQTYVIEDNSPISPSRNYQERLILPLG